MRNFKLIAAVDIEGGLGKGGTVPWKSHRDMGFFKAITTTSNKEGASNVLIMGRRTWDSIPEQFKPLPNRYNIVLSSSMSLPEARAPQAVLPSLDAALQHVLAISPYPPHVFIIGGAALYAEALAHPGCQMVYLTRVVRKDDPAASFGCDVHFPVEKLADGFTVDPSDAAIAAFGSRDDTKDDVTASLEVFLRTNTEELQYLNLIKRICEKGNYRVDRTKVGTKALFGEFSRWNLRGGVMPLLTTKRVFWRGVLEELAWFLRGETRSTTLAKSGVHIWDANGSREFLDQRGFCDREVGDLGPVYGFQWRHFGAEYVGPDADYAGKGVDQISELISGLKSDPYGRRHIVTAWNPADLSKMALPPCHMMAQFFVADGELSCMLTQRSCDVGLGVPFNIASYALLTHLVAHVTGLKPGEFIHSMGDTHIYSNHEDALLEQSTRLPRPFPTVTIDPSLTDITKLASQDVMLHDYAPRAALAMPMAV